MVFWNICLVFVIPTLGTWWNLTSSNFPKSPGLDLSPTSFAEESSCHLACRFVLRGVKMGICWGGLKGKGTLDDIIPVITIVEPCDRCFQGCLNYPDWVAMSWFVWGVWRVKLNLLGESSHDLDTWWITRGDRKSPNWAYSHSTWPKWRLPLQVKTKILNFEHEAEYKDAKKTWIRFAMQRDNATRSPMWTAPIIHSDRSWTLSWCQSFPLRRDDLTNAEKVSGKSGGFYIQVLGWSSK